MRDQPQAASWSDIYNKPQFAVLVARRRAMVLRLFTLGLLFYFSIPFLTTFYPTLLSIKIWGPVTFGLLYAVLQYPIGGAIAIAYAVSVRKIDRLATTLEPDDTRRAVRPVPASTIECAG